MKKNVTLFCLVANRRSASPPRRPAPPRPTPPVVVPPLTFPPVNGDRWLPTESYYVSETGNTLRVRVGGLRSQQRPQPSVPPVPKEKEEPVVGENIGVRGNY